MAPNVQKKMSASSILLRDVNPFITCSLCRGYFIDATSLVDCLHVFCRACILRYFENFKLACPTCNWVYKKKNAPCFRSDPMMQSLVYKLVPGLYSKEVQRREDFYRSTGVRASSSCSDDSALADLSEEHEEWVASSLDDQNQYLSPDDAISLSLEYYQPHLDGIQAPPQPQADPSVTESTNPCPEPPGELTHSANSSAEKNCDSDKDRSKDEKPKLKTEDASKRDRRYLQCPAAVTMSHLQKFLRMKYALSAEHKVDIIHSGEVLPPYFSLMDVAYTFKWERIKPMRFFFRIFTPAKIQPIRIISTSSMGGKQLQVVPAKPTNSIPTPAPPQESKDESSSLKSEEAQNYRNKERLMANLQLQSKVKMEEKKAETRTEEDVDCVYEYEEPDKDEIRAFAEKRDREWALQKQLDEEKEKHRNSKKRKKSKHSKGNLLYKKRKLHAEITQSEEKEESLKLKVKLTPHNGYKHKHHKSSHETPKPPELSSKEKLLQMRQVRHKHISTDEKKPCNNNSTEEVFHPVKVKEEVPDDHEKLPPKAEPPRKPPELPKPSEPKKPPEPVRKPPEPPKEVPEPRKVPPLPKKLPEPPKKPEPPTVSFKATQSTPKPPEPKSKEALSGGKTLRSDFSNKTNATKELCMKYPTVQLERNEQTERHAQKTFLKTFQSGSDKPSQDQGPPKPRTLPPNTYPGKNHMQVKSLEQKIANLHQQCTTVEAKPMKPELKDKKPMASPRILNSQYASAFTVSKVETGVKRKMDTNHEKRPSLEITLINPPAEKPEIKPKRPPPATIPLERIKKLGRISGISITAKPSDKCDVTGALDLSKPGRSIDTAPVTEPSKLLNGLGFRPTRPPDRVHIPDKNIQLSNLQMLSKVALEHPNINKSIPVPPKKPQMPSLQTLKIPMIQNSIPKPNLSKLPKLNEINKTQFRMPNPQMRTMRPNQNQSVRNIPNPSLLVRQQNQNRLNSLNCTPSSENKDGAKPSHPESESSNTKEDTKEKVKEESEKKTNGTSA